MFDIVSGRGSREGGEGVIFEGLVFRIFFFFFGATFFFLFQFFFFEFYHGFGGGVGGGGGERKQGEGGGEEFEEIKSFWGLREGGERKE